MLLMHKTTTKLLTFNHLYTLNLITYNGDQFLYQTFIASSFIYHLFHFINTGKYLNCIFALCYINCYQYKHIQNRSFKLNNEIPSVWVLDFYLFIYLFIYFFWGGYRSVLSNCSSSEIERIGRSWPFLLIYEGCMVTAITVKSIPTYFKKSNWKIKLCEIMSFTNETHAVVNLLLVLTFLSST